MYARADKPISMDKLENTLVPLHVAIESSFYHEVHVQPSKWAFTVKHQADRYNLMSFLTDKGLKPRGYDYPDWRQFALLDMSRPTRKYLCTKTKWYNNWNWSYLEDLVDINTPILSEDDILSILAHIRVGLESPNLSKSKESLHLYLFGLSYCKYSLIAGSEEKHDQLLPIYNSLYSLFIVKFDLHPKIFSLNSFWLVHSSLFLFPYEVGLLDLRTWLDRRSWLVNNLGLLITYGV